MLTLDQQEWINHLNDTDQVKIVAYNPQVKQIFQTYKKQLQTVLDPYQSIQHRGASAMGISGKGDIDIYIPLEPQLFNQTVIAIEGLYGKPGSVYPLKRARWTLDHQGVEVEIFVINQQDESWTTSVIFEDYLVTHPHSLHEYAKLKERLAGQSTRSYYRAKTEFINSILSQANK